MQSPGSSPPWPIEADGRHPRLAALLLLAIAVGCYRLHAGAAELGDLTLRVLLELMGLVFVAAGVVVARLPLLSAALLLQGLHWGGPATLFGDERIDGVPYLVLSGALPAALELHFALRAWRPDGAHRLVRAAYVPLAVAVALAVPVLAGADLVAPFLLVHAAQTYGFALLVLVLLVLARKRDPLFGRLAAVFGGSYALFLALSVAFAGEAPNLALIGIPVGCALVVSRSSRA